jgi:hypothetical protein
MNQERYRVNIRGENTGPDIHATSHYDAASQYAGNVIRNSIETEMIIEVRCWEPYHADFDHHESYRLFRISNNSVHEIQREEPDKPILKFTATLGRNFRGKPESKTISVTAFSEAEARSYARAEANIGTSVSWEIRKISQVD